MVQFSPVSVLPENEVKPNKMGRMRVRTWYEKTISHELVSSKGVTVVRPPGYKKPVPPAPVVVVTPDPVVVDPKPAPTPTPDPSKICPDGKTKIDGKCPTTIKTGGDTPIKNKDDQKDKTLGETAKTDKGDCSGKKNWDGECISKDEPWYDESLFKITDYDVTTKDALIASSSFIVIIIAICAICSYVSYRKRRAIRIGVQLMSDSIMEKFNASIKSQMAA